MRLFGFVCLRAWTGPDGKGAGLGSTKGVGWGPPPPSGGGGGLQPPKLSHTPRGHTLVGARPRGAGSNTRTESSGGATGVLPGFQHFAITKLSFPFFSKGNMLAIDAPVD